VKNEQKNLAGAAKLYGFGGLLLVVFLIQVVSGIYLAFYYQPSPSEAWKSVVFIGKEPLLGDFFFALHRWAAFVAAILLIFHIMYHIWGGTYRKVRKDVWFSGVLLMLFAFAFAITGYLLPWDYRSYCVALTMVNWQENLPLFSSFLSWLLSEAPGGAVPVARWFVLHAVLLPILTSIALPLHFFAMRRHGIRMITMKNSAAAAALLLLLGLLAVFGIHKQDFADPITTSPYPQPDWLFFVFYQVTRYFQDGREMIGVFWIPMGVIFGLCFLPFMGRGSGQSVFRWPLFVCGLVLCLTLATFTYRTGSTTPAWSCLACHKEGFGQTFARAPVVVKKFPKRYNNKWLAMHYRYPQYFWMMDADVPAW